MITIVHRASCTHVNEISWLFCSAFFLFSRLHFVFRRVRVTFHTPFTISLCVKFHHTADRGCPHRITTSPSQTHANVLHNGERHAHRASVRCGVLCRTQRVLGVVLFLIKRVLCVHAAHRERVRSTAGRGCVVKGFCIRTCPQTNRACMHAFLW